MDIKINRLSNTGKLELLLKFYNNHWNRNICFDNITF